LITINPDFAVNRLVTVNLRCDVMAGAQSVVLQLRILLTLTLPMHRALEIPEVLLSMFDEVYFGSDRGKSDTLSLALTCKRFQEPALDVLWRLLPTIFPLILCLPDNALKLPFDFIPQSPYSEPNRHSVVGHQSFIIRRQQIVTLWSFIISVSTEKSTTPT
jgi:hypothetical protein